MAEVDNYANHDAIHMSPTSQHIDLAMKESIYANVSPSDRPERATASKPYGAVKNYRWVSVCLALLCVLLLALNIGLGVKYTMEKDQLQAEREHLLESYVVCTMERDLLDAEREHLLERYVNVTMDRNLLDAHRKHLLESHVNVTMERDQVSAMNTNLTRQVEELHITNGQLQARISKLEKKCPYGWSYFNTKCYLISSSEKTWPEGRQHCIDNGGDLVIINSKEEQVFIHGMGTVWIGLRNNTGVWKWVDNTQLSTKYWAKGQPDYQNEYCVRSPSYEGDPFSSWHNYQCSHKAHFICELSAYI